MAISRIYQPITLFENTIISLDEQGVHHIGRVLRAKVGDKLTVFNGQGGEYEGSITEISKKNISVTIQTYHSREAESPLELYLAQGISRGEKMDYTIQKAVELGVKKIFPILTERCNVKLDEERREKRLQHWRSIIIGACEQSGRNRIPDISPPQLLNHFIENHVTDFKFVLTPQADEKLTQIAIPNHACVSLLIGPEGGLSDKEVKYAQQHGFHSLNLGPRVLRTETAAVAAITALQCYAGDLM